MRSLVRLAPLVIAVIALLSAGLPAIAGNTLEKLLMPGPVISGHAKIESDCQACHTPFSKDAQDKLCLDCHKEIRTDVNTKRGFHGRSPLIKGHACNFCHDDHKGRNEDIVQLNPPLFDHVTTNFPLEGPHQYVPCASCHVTEKRWAEAPAACFDCHGKEDPHKGNLGRQCGDCHAVAAWYKPKPFDHDKTKFKLTGRHRQTTCASCHMGEFYKGTSTACNDCHAVQDVHEARFGAGCRACHDETAWRPAKFDHGKMTRFALKGAHANAKCEACHGSNVLARISLTCAGCHTGQDVHQGKLGSGCGDCHTEVSWREDVRFDHGLTKFPLTGLHPAVACEACHESQTFQTASTNCASCHAEDDAHAGRFAARCESCHSANGWTRVSFDHGKDTKFALTGKHARIGCYDCHVRKNVTDASLPTDCFSCHAKQDVHRGKFGRGCERCHGTVTFKSAVIRQ